jgi:hypothetical protein
MVPRRCRQTEFEPSQNLSQVLEVLPTISVVQDKTLKACRFVKCSTTKKYPWFSSDSHLILFIACVGVNIALLLRHNPQFPDEH